MTQGTRIETGGQGEAPKRFRILLLGEFSAGKSTLANALLGQISSPMCVTATQVPPIWYSAGSGDPVRVASDGSETPLPRAELGAVPISGTRAIRVFLESDFLQAADLIDMPGSADPNMSADIWDAMLPLADFVLWCSPATQAWRKSEAALWETVPEALYERSLLLLTRIDKVPAAQDRARLIARVRRETRGLFRHVLTVSPLSALGAADDRDRCNASGLPDVKAAIAELLERQRNPARPDPAEIAAQLRHARSDRQAGRADAAAAGTAQALPPIAQQVPDPAPMRPTAAASSIAPRRVSREGTGRRPSRETLI